MAKQIKFDAEARQKILAGVEKLSNAKFDAEARQKILAGVEKLSNAVTSTLGPSGRNVILDKKFGSPQITKDGVTVAKEIELPDPFENMGAQMVKEVASKTNDVAGDGTTTATLLAESIYREGLKNLTAGANAMALKRGIDKATAAVVDAIAKQSKKVKTADEIAQVATLSANGDEEIGKMISEAMDKVGKEGTITVEEAKTLESSLDVVEGMQFDKGYLSPYFVTNPDAMECELEDPFILLLSASSRIRSSSSSRRRSRAFRTCFRSSSRSRSPAVRS